MSDKTLKRSRVPSSSETMKKSCSTTKSRITKRVRPEEKGEGPPQKISKCPSHLKPFLKRRQYGGGPKIPEFVKKDHFPTAEEKEFFFKHAELSKDLQLKRQNAAYMELEAMRMSFIGLDKITSGEVLHVHVANLIDILIRMMIEKAGGNLEDTHYWLQLSHEGYNEERGFFVMHKTYKHVDGGVVMNQLATHMQSNKNISLDESFTVAMSVFKEKPRGNFVRGGFRGQFRKRFRGRGTRKSEKVQNSLLESIFGIRQNRVIGESHCAVKAIVLAKMDTDIKTMEDGEEKERLANKLHNLTRHQTSLKTREKNQLRLAKEFLTELNMDSDQEEHGLEDIEEIAKLMPDYQFIIWGIEGRQTVASEAVRFNTEGTKFIGLFYHNHHYEYIVHIVGTKPARFCYKCSKFDGSNHWLTCEATCKRCGTTDCEPGKSKIHCDTCNLDFRSQKCFDSHRKPSSHKALPFCKKYFYCKDCHTVDRTEEYGKVAHKCGAKYFCSTCGEKAKTDHICAHPVPTCEDKKKKRALQEKWKVLVYDMECIVAESGEFNGNCIRGPKHQPNFICVRMFCSDCHGKSGCKMCGEPWYYSYRDSPNEAICVVQAEKTEESSDDENFDFEPVFAVEERNTPLARFGKFLLKDPKANNAYIIAHNGGGYDHPLLLGELDRQGGTKSREPQVILKGLKIISAVYRYGKQKLYFRDSLQYIPMPLSKMPEGFELTGEAKGFFPHLFNHPDNYDKILKTLPPKEYYSPKHMAPSVREEFDKWHDEAYHDGFVLHDELLKYCESDVRILTLTLIAYIELCGKLFNGWNPIVQSTTLASFSKFVMKHEYINPGDIGYVPETGFGGDRTSMLALKYIQWLEKQEVGLRLQYALRGGEYQICTNGHNYKVDAYNKDTNEVIEIHGCLWHGCPKCHPIRDKKNSICQATPQELYARTKEREEDIKKAGFNLRTIWECEINDELERNLEMRKFFKLNKYTRRLNPREGVFGGRTQAFRSITKATKNTKIDYYDVVSMYPYLNAGGTAYPRGNPIILIDDDLPPADEPLTLRGIVFCDCLPAKDAKMGYLPGRFNHKLMFPLCRSCAEDLNTGGQCPHYKVSERYLTGVWTTDELNKAISRGYKVLKYHEIWFWPEEDWIKGGFFAKYIKPLLAIKYQSSGWPRENMSKVDKKKYVDDVKEKDGVELDASKIQKNKAMRSLSKIFLNSAWGKFAQNPMKTETRLILKSDAATISNFFNDPLYEPTGMKTLGEHKLWISRKPKKDSTRAPPFSHLPIGIITTSAGRLRLMEGIERVGVENMIYCDTDSLMFKRKTGEDPLGDLKGEHLGLFVSEIPKGKEITSSVVMAPKSYSISIRDEKNKTITHNTKTKGITMHCENAQRINHETMMKTMKEFVEYGVADALEGEMLTFKRGEHAFDGLWTCVMKKDVRPNMDKGHYVEGVAVPYGQLSSDTILEDDYPFY